jgi:hypothetical protein
MYENTDEECIKETPLFKGGYFNGHAPNPKGIMVDGKRGNMFIFNPHLRGCPKSGMRLVFENQLQRTLTTKRKAPHGNVLMPVNLQFTASMLFKPNSAHVKFPLAFRREEERVMTALNASTMTIKDLCPITPEEAVVNDAIA